MLRVDRSLLLKPVTQTPISPTARQSTPDSSTTVVLPLTEIPDSVERPSTQAARENEIEIETPPPVTKKVSWLKYEADPR